MLVSVYELDVDTDLHLLGNLDIIPNVTCKLLYTFTFVRLIIFLIEIVDMVDLITQVSKTFMSNKELSDLFSTCLTLN